MHSLSLIVHLVNFLAPAIFMSAWSWLISGLFWRHKPAMFKPWQRFVLNSLAGFAVLFGGLVLGGQDGKMLTYTLLVLVCATLQWVFFKAWRN
jgi:hypothetical protein